MTHTTFSSQQLPWNYPRELLLFLILRNFFLHFFEKIFGDKKIVRTFAVFYTTTTLTLDNTNNKLRHIYFYTSVLNAMFKSLTLHLRRTTAVSVIAIAASALTANAQLLWRISGNGLEKPSYIFGTHHCAPASTADSTTGFAEALQSVEQVYGEIEMAKMASPDIQQYMASVIMAPADSTLDKVLTPEQIAQVNEYLGKITGGMPLTTASFNSMRPAMLSNTISMLLMKQILPDFNPLQTLDGSIQQKALAMGKTVGGLETPEFQINVLFGSPISQQAEALIRNIESTDDPFESARRMTAAYLSGDLETLYGIIIDPDKGMTGQEADTLIYNRNEAWIEFLMGMLPTTTMMIVVGAGHLPGERGVINLLRKAGYEVTPA